MITRTTDYHDSQGFILPTIMIICLGVIITALALIQSSTSIQASIANQYYTHIANEAAEAGMTYAAYCIKTNGNVQTWGPAVGKPNLTQSTNCFGAPLSPAISSLSGDTGVVSTFSVGDLATTPSGSFIVNASGSVARKNDNAVTVGTYGVSAKRVIGLPSITYSNLTLGYYYYTPSSAQSGAFYAVKGSDGNYKTAGSNDLGTLGIGNFNYQSSPQTYQLPSGVRAKQAYTNTFSQAYNLFVITTDGDVYGTGLNNTGQLGNGSVSSAVNTPVKMNLGSEKAVAVATQGQASFVITQSNKVLSVGECANGKLGIGSCSGNKTTMQQVILPTDSTNPDNNVPVEIATDANTVYLRMQGGKVFAWGQNTYSQIGDGTTNDASIPKQVGTLGNPGQPKATQITTDGNTLYVLDDAGGPGNGGNVWVVGRNDFGQAGFSHNTSTVTTFKKISFPAGTGFIAQVVTDQWTALFRTVSGQVYGVGLHNVGEIGDGTYGSYTNSPQKMLFPSGVTAQKIFHTSTGTDQPNYDYTIILGTDGKVYGTGSNAYGQLGLGTSTQKYNKPQQMLVIDGSTIVVSDVAVGLGTTIMLATNGTYYSTGNNAYGQLGNGSTAPYITTPVVSKLFGGTQDYVF